MTRASSTKKQLKFDFGSKFGLLSALGPYKFFTPEPPAITTPENDGRRGRRPSLIVSSLSTSLAPCSQLVDLVYRRVDTSVLSSVISARAKAGSGVVAVFFGSCSLFSQRRVMFLKIMHGFCCRLRLGLEVCCVLEQGLSNQTTLCSCIAHQTTFRDPQIHRINAITRPAIRLKNKSINLSFSHFYDLNLISTAAIDFHPYI